jgi:hypothetical protein
MATKSPLGKVKETFGDKAKLVEAVKAFTTEELWVGRLASDRGKERGLEHVSNAKLLRLHAIFTEVKEKFGTRAKLIDAILTLENRVKDTGLRIRLEKHPVPRLYDQYRALSKRVSTAAKKAAWAAEKSAKAKA